MYRAQKPKSWWWTPEINMLAQVILVGQWGNWQRGGGKGQKPKPIEPPKDLGVKGAKSVQELTERKRRQREHLQRRRAEKQREVNRPSPTK